MITAIATRIPKMATTVICSCRVNPRSFRRKSRVFGSGAPMIQRGYRRAGCEAVAGGEAAAPLALPTTLDELYAVAVRVADEEDPASTAHGVGLALEVYSTGLLELLRQGIEILDGEGDVTVAFA